MPDRNSSLRIVGLAAACAVVGGAVFLWRRGHKNSSQAVQVPQRQAQPEPEKKAVQMPPAPVASEERTQGLALFSLLKAKANEAFQRNELDAALEGYQEAADCLHALGLDSETLVMYQTIQANAALVMNKQERFEEAVNVTTFMLNHPAPMSKDLTVKVLYRRAIARKGLGDLKAARSDLKEALMYADGSNADVAKEIERIDALMAKAV
jgi:tetratricopeptide (TPR) repeat protein